MSTVLAVRAKVFATTLVIPSTYLLSPTGFVIRATQKIEIQTGGTLSSNGSTGNNGSAGGAGGAAPGSHAARW